MNLLMLHCYRQQGPELQLKAGFINDRNTSRVETETAKGRQQEREQNII